jgi:hypothetical protein
MCLPLFDRTPLSRYRDCYSLTKISEILCGRQRFGMRQRFDHFEYGGPVQTGWYRGESPPTKAGHGELLPHLESTCTRFNTSARRRTRPSAGPERSHLLQTDSAEPNSKAILQRICLLFLLCQHWRAPSFSCCTNIGGRLVFPVRQYFPMHQGFGICQGFWMRQCFCICQGFWMRQCFCIYFPASIFLCIFLHSY